MVVFNSHHKYLFNSHLIQGPVRKITINMTQHQPSESHFMEGGKYLEVSISYCEIHDKVINLVYKIKGRFPRGVPSKLISNEKTNTK